MPGTDRRPFRATIAAVREAPGSKRIEVPAGMSSRKPCAASRSKSRPGFTSARCTCEPTWIGRSAVLVKVSSARSSGPRSALISNSPGLTRIAPGPDVDTPAMGAPLRSVLSSCLGRRAH